MKKLVMLVTTAMTLGLLAGCSNGQTDVQETEKPEATETLEHVELTVYAAASLTETLEEIAELYKEVAPNVELVFTFDSSGTLKTQIEEGAECDVFISAAQKQMDQLDLTAGTEKNPDSLDFVQSETRMDLLENKVALAVPEGNLKNITSYDVLAGLLKDGEILMAMGGADVPVGQYTQKILAYYQLDEAAVAGAGKITYGTNVKDVTTQVADAAVDCGVIYSTDAFSAKLTVVDTATAEMCGQVIYPAAVMKASKQAEEAKEFLEYLTEDEAAEVFEAVGFTTLN